MVPVKKSVYKTTPEMRTPPLFGTLEAVSMCVPEERSSVLPHPLDNADKAGESDPFTDIEEDKDELEENELVLDNCLLYTVNVSLTSHSPFMVLLCNIMHWYRVTRFIDVCMCHSNSSRGYYFFPHIWRCSFYLRVATN